MSKRCRDIPVGNDGYVPKKELVRRFHEVGSPRDAGRDSSTVLPAKVTPEQVTVRYFEFTYTLQIDPQHLLGYSSE